LVSSRVDTIILFYIFGEEQESLLRTLVFAIFFERLAIKIVKANLFLQFS
jgi:hypothetical protein